MIPNNIKEEFYTEECYFSINPTDVEEMKFIKNQFKNYNNLYLDDLIKSKQSSIETISKYPNIVFSGNNLVFTKDIKDRKCLGNISSYMNLIPLNLLIKTYLKNYNT